MWELDSAIGMQWFKTKAVNSTVQHKTQKDLLTSS